METVAMKPASGPTAFDVNRVYEIEMERIFSDAEFNCRGIIDPTSVMQLANDIRHKGLTEPIILQPWNDKKEFRIVAGYRRFMAHQINKAKTIRALIKEGLTDLDARLINLSENLHRQDLNIKQEAHAIDHFRRAGWSEGEVAQKVEQSRGWVQVRFMLLELPTEIQDEAAAGMLSQQQIREAWALPSAEMQFNFVKEIKERKFRGKKRPVKPSQMIAQNERRPRTVEEIEALQDIIREVFGHNTESTRALAWSGGFISDLEIHRDIARWAAEHKPPKFYLVPDGLEGTRAPQKSTLDRKPGDGQ